MTTPSSSADFECEGVFSGRALIGYVVSDGAPSSWEAAFVITAAPDLQKHSGLSRRR